MNGAFEVVRTLEEFMRGRGGELTHLTATWLTAREHARRGVCDHRGRCPRVRVSPVVVDEGERVLHVQMLRRAPKPWRDHHTIEGMDDVRLDVPEAELGERHGELREAAGRVVRDLGLRPYAQAGRGRPLGIVCRRAPGGGRTETVVRYLFRTHSDLAARSSAGMIWVPLRETAPDLRESVGAALFRTGGT